MSKAVPTARLAIAALAALLATSAAASAQQFSAELSRRDKDGQISMGRLAAAGDKVRIEAPDLPSGFFIVRGDAKAVYFVQPDRRVFMDARQSSVLTEIMVPVDPEAPCPKWQAMAEISRSAEGGAAWRCERIGEDTRDGRATIRYGMTSPRGRHYSGWIDPRLKFVVRIEADDGATTELADVREGPQPDSAFEIPAGLHKFDPQQLIELMKHSDVWVDPAKDSRAEPLK
ncbi:MAG: hypothetical protein P4M07_28050 [Xanthobacteraceae bacterium]|nr:hypothetical protein [Xanthobacteraceae bacterium]